MLAVLWWFASGLSGLPVASVCFGFVSCCVVWVLVAMLAL